MTTIFTLRGSRKGTMMGTRRSALFLLGMLLATALRTTGVSAQADQRAVADRLLHGNALERGRALEAAQAIKPSEIGPDLRGALITSLEREGRIHAQREEAGWRGEALAPLEDPEFIFRVSRAVAALQDPRAIPALTGALGTGSGSPATRALVAFGDQAVPALLAVVRSSDSPHYLVDGGLIALRFMVEGAGPSQLSARSLDEIRQAAKQRLTGKQYFTTVWWAIDLAIALDDGELRRIVASLSVDRGAIVARGIEKPELIERTQKIAADRLAGVPPLPRWR